MISVIPFIVKTSIFELYVMFTDNWCILCGCDKWNLNLDKTGFEGVFFIYTCY